MERNRAIRVQRHALAGLTRDNGSFQDLFSSKDFLNKIFTFFLPSLCKFRPIGFVDGYNTSKVEPRDARPSPVLVVHEKSFHESSADQASQTSPTTAGVSQAWGPSAVIEQSPEDKKQEENDELMNAIVRSKTEVVTLSGDGVLLLRLTRMARSSQVLDVLLESPMLDECRQRVIEAGCEVAPDGSSGAKFFVPVTHVQLEELAAAGFELLDHHILALRTDKELIEQALQSLPRKRRPRLSPACLGVHEVSGKHQCPPEQDDKLGGMEEDENEEGEDEVEICIVVEHAFSTDSSLGFAEWCSHDAVH